jgi:hypothetical protein
LNDILKTQLSDDKLDGTLEFGDSKDNTSTWARAYDKTLYLDEYKFEHFDKEYSKKFTRKELI